MERKRKLYLCDPTIKIPLRIRQRCEKEYSPDSTEEATMSNSTSNSDNSIGGMFVYYALQLTQLCMTLGVVCVTDHEYLRVYLVVKHAGESIQCE